MIVSNKLMNKTFCLLIAMIFFVNNLAYGLAPGVISGDLRPNHAEIKDKMFAGGQKEFAALTGPGAIDFGVFEPAVFTGEVPKIPEVDFNVQSGQPKEWENNLILSKDVSTLSDALEIFFKNELQISDSILRVQVRYYKPEKVTEGELPLTQLEYDRTAGRWTLVIHPMLAVWWSDIKANDVLFNMNLPNPDDPTKTERRTVSLAWAIFYRIAKHEMMHLVNDAPKNERLLNERLANEISGRYALVNEAAWMWFLGSYCFDNNTQYNNDTLKDRLLWFFGFYSDKSGDRDRESEWNQWAIAHGLPDEFPNLREKAVRDEAIALAQAINHKYYSRYGYGSGPISAEDRKLQVDEEEFVLPEALAKAYSIKKIKAAGHVVGVPKEIKPQAERVGLTPKGVKFLVDHGVQVIVERGAGRHHFSDAEYEAAGGKLVDKAEDVWSMATIIKKVKEPLGEELNLMKEGQIIFTYLHLASPELKALAARLVEKKVTGIAYETIETIENGRKVTPALRPMSIIAGNLGGYYAGLYLAESTLVNDKVVLSTRGRQMLNGIKRSYLNIVGFVGLLDGKEAVVLGGGVSGQQMAERLLEQGAKVTITDISEARLAELRTIFVRYGDRFMAMNPGKEIDNPSDELLSKYISADILGGCILTPGGLAPKMSAELLGKISKEHKKVLIDIALDQGGNFAGSYSRHYDDPVFVDEFGNKRFSVPNMPDAVGRVASIELEKTNIMYTLALALGLEEAMRVLPELKGGLNTFGGKITHPKVIEAMKPDPFEVTRQQTKDISAIIDLDPVFLEGLGEDFKKPLIEVISECFAPVMNDKGPGRTEPSPSEIGDFYPVFELIDNQTIEICVPQGLKTSIIAAEAVEDEIARLNKRIISRTGRKDEAISIKPYTSSNIESVLGRKGDGVRRIFINDMTMTDVFSGLAASSRVSLLQGNRLITVNIPQGKDRMEDSVNQAWLIKVAILSALVEEKNMLTIGNALKSELAGRIETGIDINEFVSNLFMSDNESREAVASRIKYFLGAIVKLSQFIGEQIRILKAFWTAA